MAERQATPYAFVSYASADRERVLRVLEALREAGIAVWLDQQGIAGGDNYAREIADAIKGAAALLLLASPASLASRNVKQEVALGWRYARPYLPLRLDPVAIPDDLAYWLEAAQWIDVLDRPAQAWLSEALAALGKLGLTPAPLPPAPGAPELPPTAPRHNLPAQLTSFVGRERELADLGALLAAQRLVTLTGVGGTGKTRLALAAAERALPHYPDGTWLAELAPLADPALVPRAVAAVLGVREQPGEPLLTTLADALAPRRLLLVLDNCEHLIDACAHLAEALLRHCPGVRVLATSREQLGVPGEIAYRVPSLALPASTDDAAALAGTEAVRLFVARAQAAQPRFALTDANAALVARVCARLDGIPLALELAAARLRALPVEHLAQRLDDRFRLLTGGSRTALPRHQTLQATLDWSYRLLDAEERTLLQRLSVFAGGWTLDAAEAICADEHLESWRVLDLLTGLADKSLMQVDESGEQGARYRLLETVRQYAQERLLDTDDALPLRQRHAAWYQALMARESPHLELADRQLAALAICDAELDNLRQTLAWCRDHDPAAGLGLAIAFYVYWDIRGLYTEGRDWLTTLLAQPGLPDMVRASGLYSLGQVLHGQGELRAALAAYEESLALLRGHGGRTEADLLRLLAMTVGSLGDWVRARQLIEEGVTLSEALGDRPQSAICRGSLGSILFWSGEHDRGLTLVELALADLRAGGITTEATGGTLGYLYALSGDLARARAEFARVRGANQRSRDQFRGIFLAWFAGHVEYLAGDDAAALPLLDAGLAIGRQTGLLYTADVLATLGPVLHRLGDLRGARRAVAEGLQRSRRAEYHWASLRGLEAAARVLGGITWTEQTVRLLAAADRERARRSLPLPPADSAEQEAALRVARTTLGDDSFNSAWAAGQALAFEAALDEAQALLAGE